jgi:glyoxylase-like metal-dependent hydrolase (beta-lactamase superfamily II)
MQVERLTLSNPVFDMEGDNTAYLLVEGGTVGLVDVGVATDRTRADLEAGLERHGHSLSAVDHVFLTHWHPDHAGLAGQVQAAGAGVRTDNGDAQFGGQPLGTSLLHEVLVVAGQSREPPQQRHTLRFGLGRQIDGKDHLAVQRPRAMTIAFVPTTEAAIGRDQFEIFGHGHGRFLVECAEYRAG